MAACPPSAAAFIHIEDACKSYNSRAALFDIASASVNLRDIHRRRGYRMLRITRFLGLALSFLTLAACGHSGAPTTPSGSKLSIMVFFDRTIPTDTPPEKASQLQQVVDWMEPDLIEVLQSAGYDAGAVGNADAPTGPGRYLLRAQIVNYNGGSKAARMFVGWGAGSARLETSFELVGPGAASYVKGTPGCATGRADWRHAARKVNQEITNSVTMRLRQSL
jgi:hypothetical protein